MITNNGVEIISKYLVGQASSYASYIAVGSGPRPTSNSQGITIVPSGMTVGAVSGSGPYTSTITITGSGADDYFSYLEVGDVLTATAGTGSLGSGVVTVTSINSPKQIGISSTATMTAGAGLTNLKVYSSLKSKSLSNKASLDFEMGRFPITSRSYVVEKQTVTPSSLSIISQTEVVVTISSGHPFGIGDEVSIIGVLIPVAPSVNAGIEVNGVYTITAISDTTFTAKVPDNAVVGWTSANYSTPYVGLAYNNSLFFATVFTKQVSLTAELSDTSRYDISELGVYSLGSNQYSTSGNSRMLLNFTGTEGWQYYNNSTTSFTDVETLTSITLPIGTAPKFCSSSAGYWSNTYVKLRQEKPKILDDGLIVPGALSSWDGTSSAFFSTSDYLLLSDPGVNLSKSSGTDQVRLAYSIMNAVSTPTALPTALYITFEFTCSNGLDSAKLTFIDSKPSSTVIYPNRYSVLTKTMSEISSTAGFDWAKVTSVKVYCALENAAGTPTDDYAVILDGLRFENVGTENPLYALTAYTIVNNTTASSINKVANSNDLINFRIDLSVGK